MALTDKFAKQEMKSEYSDGFIDITYYSKDDLAKLSIGDFVKFSGTFHFNTITNIHISCENNNFDIAISYTPIADKSLNFDTDTEYSTIFKGIWGSFIVDLFDVESSFSEASEYKSLEDYFKEYDDISQESNLPTDIYSKSEDLSYKSKDLKKQVDTLSKQVETLTIDRDNLSNQVISLQDKLKELHNQKVDLSDKLDKSRKQALEQHNQVLKQIDSNKDILGRYNNLVDVYNHLRKDYSALQENYKVLKTQNTNKNQVIEFLLGIVGVLFLIIISF